MRFRPSSNERPSESSTPVRRTLKATDFSPQTARRNGADPSGYSYSSNSFGAPAAMNRTSAPHSMPKTTRISSMGADPDGLSAVSKPQTMEKPKTRPQGLSESYSRSSERQEDMTRLSKLIWDRDWDGAKAILAKSRHRTTAVAIESTLPCFPLGSTGLPLHLACTMRPLPPLSFVERLVRAYPEACRMRQRTWGLLPLHLAADLSLHSNETARVSDRKGNGAVTPRTLHLSSPYHGDDEIRDDPLEVPSTSSSLLGGADDSSEPLNHACIVHLLVQAYPESIYAREDTNGMLPLHIAASTARSENGVVSPTSAAVLEVLAKLAPSTRDMEDGYGDTPVALAWREALFFCYQCGNKGSAPCLCKNRVTVAPRYLHPLLRDDIEKVATPSEQKRSLPPPSPTIEFTTHIDRKTTDYVDYQSAFGQSKSNQRENRPHRDHSTRADNNTLFHTQSPETATLQRLKGLSLEERIQIRQQECRDESPISNFHRTQMTSSQTSESPQCRTAMELQPRPTTPPEMPQSSWATTTKTSPRIVEENEKIGIAKTDGTGNHSENVPIDKGEEKNNGATLQEEPPMADFGAGEGMIHLPTKQRQRLSHHAATSDEEDKSLPKLAYHSLPSNDSNLESSVHDFEMPKGMAWSALICKRRGESETQKDTNGASRKATVQLASMSSHLVDQGALLWVSKSNIPGKFRISEESTPSLRVVTPSGLARDSGGNAFDFNLRDNTTFSSSSHLRRHLMAHQSPLANPYPAATNTHHLPPSSPGISSHGIFPSLSAVSSSRPLQVLRIQLRLTDLRRPIRTKHPKRPPNPYYEIYVTNGENVASRYQSYPLMGTCQGTWDEALLDVSCRRVKKKSKKEKGSTSSASSADGECTTPSVSVDGALGDPGNLQIGIRVMHCKRSQMGTTAGGGDVNVIGLCRTSFDKLREEPRQPILNGFHVMGWLDVLQLSLV